MLYDLAILFFIVIDVLFLGIIFYSLLTLEEKIMRKLTGKGIIEQITEYIDEYLKK